MTAERPRAARSTRIIKTRLIALEAGAELVKSRHFVAAAFGRGLSVLDKDGNLGGTEAGLLVLAPFRRFWYRFIDPETATDPP